MTMISRAKPPTPPPAAPKIASSFTSSLKRSLLRADLELGSRVSVLVGNSERLVPGSPVEGVRAAFFEADPLVVDGGAAGGFPNVEFGIRMRNGGLYSNWPVESSTIFIPYT